MHTTIEAVYDNGEFILKEIPNVRKARVLITFIREINDDVKRKVKFPTKKLGRIKNFEREEIYGDYLSDRY
jgi:predicted DNA-binding antitoxin AbrB/MazE fold protein